MKNVHSEILFSTNKWIGILTLRSFAEHFLLIFRDHFLNGSILFYASQTLKHSELLNFTYLRPTSKGYLHITTLENVIVTTLSSKSIIIDIIIFIVFKIGNSETTRLNFNNISTFSKKKSTF